MPHADQPSQLAEFQCLLIGSWSNDIDKLSGAELAKLSHKRADGTTVPLSFNVMPLPQIQNQGDRPDDPTNAALTYGGFILKNFTFTETIRFNGAAETNDAHHRDPAALAVIAGAPNRGGGYTQSCHAVFYDQQVRFAEGPEGPNGALKKTDVKKLGDVVHVENGAWLHLESEQQVLGPYKLHDTGPFVDRTVLPQPPYITIAKQIAVPHGNSVLALGNFDVIGLDKDHKPIIHFPGAPAIPDAFVPYPAPADIACDPHTNPYDRPDLNRDDDYENPDPKWTWNANEPLQNAVKNIKPTSFIHWKVTTLPLPGGKGSVTNIPFEDRKAKVTEYWADYWLLDVEKKSSYDYLVYNQVILMEMDIYQGKGSIADPKSFRRYVFPHVTANTVVRIGKNPADGRKQTGGCAGC